MSFKQCTACGKWYKDNEYRTCRIVDCPNFTGTYSREVSQAIRRPLPRVESLEKPAAPAAAPAPSFRSATPPPAMAVSRRDSRAASPPPVASSSSAVATPPPPDCVVCCCEGEGVDTPCCKAHVCDDCVRRGQIDALFSVTGSSVNCQYCKAAIEPNFYQGKVPQEVLVKLNKRVEYSRSSETPVNVEEMAWNLSLQCPSCRQSLPSLDGGCDIITCKCGAQVNLATGTASKSGLAHTFLLGEFMKFISDFAVRSGGFVIKQCQGKFAGLWRTFKFDVLLERLERARGSNEEVTAILDKLVAVEVQSLKAYLLSKYLT